MPVPMGFAVAPPEVVRRRNYLLGVTSTSETTVGVQRVASDRYWCFGKLTSSRYWISMFEPTYNPSTDTGLIAMLYHAIGRLGFSFDDTYGLGSVTGVNQEDASVARVGTWSNNNTQAAAYGGDYRYSTTSGSTVTFTSPSACTAMGLYTLVFPNGGFAKAEIDGDTTKCNLLPTAQELVDAGVMPSSGLTTFIIPGPFAPTDRVVNFYNSNNVFNRDIPVASGLTLAVHALKLTVSATIPNGGTSNRTYDSGYYYGTSTTGITTVHLGSGWSSDIVKAAAYGGSFKYSTTSGDKVTFNVPASTGVTVRSVAAANGGVAKVKIDGSSTAANRLPTAQQMVDAGDMLSTYLTTAGGPLAPTDRVISFYQPNDSYDFGIDIADNLSATAHTVEIICTTAREIGSSGNRLYSSGYSYTTSSMALGDPGVAPVPTRMVQYDQSHVEYALDVNVAGGTHTIIGNGHGYDVPISLGWKVDGSTVNLTSNGQVAFGSTVVATRVSDLRHPSFSAGAASIGGSTTVYTLDRTGLDVDWTITWTQPITLITGWVGMFAMSDRYMSRASIVGAGTDYNMVENNNSDIEYGLLVSDCAYIWDPTNDDVIALYWSKVRPEAQLYNAYSSKNMFVQDRAGPRFTKIYLQNAFGAAAPIPAGTTWHNKSLYRVAYVPGINALVHS